MSASDYRIAPDPAEKGWPKGVKYIIGNEGCERFSYYGMRSILVVFMTRYLMGPDGKFVAHFTNTTDGETMAAKIAPLL